MHCAKVLIVDDEPISRQNIAEGLRGKNFDVIEAESGLQAIERIQKKEMDIVISDMVMPGMDGLELLKKAMRLQFDVPFLLVTGYPSQAAAANVMKAGASDYLAKPVTSEELMHRVSRALFLKSLDKPLAPARGAVLGTAISAVVWTIIIGALSTLFR
jgi:DNA-binding NtrC family response regulator